MGVTVERVDSQALKDKLAEFAEELLKDAEQNEREAGECAENWHLELAASLSGSASSERDTAERIQALLRS